ncbi:MAG: hypothetical protein GXP06_08185 [Alphaproteobacteria bacterium]|nr:hypothetical protein [Alphaproteobacteria bacterium]
MAGRVKATILPQTYEVRRSDDFLYFDYRLNNLRVMGSAPNQVIARINAQKPAWIVVEHQAQSIDEQAYWENIPSQPDFPNDPQPMPGTETTPTPPTTAMSRISGRSKLVFQMPSGVSQSQWGLDGLLEACRTWPMRLDALAKPPPPAFELFIVPPRVFQLSQQRLDSAAQVLLASLPADQRAVIGDIIPGASKRIADKINAAAKRGEEISDADIDALVGAELQAGLTSSPAVQTLEHAFLSRRALEAAAASASLSVLAQAAPARRLQRRAPIQPNRIIKAPNITMLPLQLKPRKPADSVTAIELPYRLVQTPLATAGWAHALGPITHSKRTELWHTRLGTRKGDGVADLSPEPLRAIWSPDYPNSKSAIGGAPRFALYGAERRDIVRLTAGFNEKKPGGGAFVPKPTTAKKLMLTALGGWLDLDGAWRSRPTTLLADLPPGVVGPPNRLPSVDIESWTHKTAMARDYYVRIVKAGRLFPFGHAASLVRITERKFKPRADGGRVAVLSQRAFIIVREPVREYKGGSQPNLGRDFPFRRVEMVTKLTPDLQPPGDENCDRVFPISPTSPADAGFVPVLLGSGGDVQFRMVGIDGAGRRIPFSAPLVLVLDSKNNTNDINTVSNFYSSGKPSCSSAQKKRAVVPMSGAVIQYAPQSAGGDLDGDTNIPTESIRFKGAPPTGGVNIGEPRFFPAIEEAKVILPAVKSLLGTDKSPTVTFNDKYLANGFAGANTKGQLFLNVSLPGAITVDAAEPSDKFGGMITPDLKPSALSRNFGVVAGASDAQNFSQGSFKPEDFLPNAKLLGAIELKDILQAVVNIVSEKAKTPKFTSIELPDRIEATYSLEQSPLRSVSPIFEAMPGSRLKIDTKIVVRRDKLNVPPPEASVEGRVENFQINLFSCLILTFDQLSFVTVPGQKPKVDVDLDPEFGVMFGGPLEFINELKDIIPSNGFSDPSPISLTPTGITAGYTLGLPTIQVGICSISNISIGAKFSIPFTGGPPSARFNFAERQSPFNITVSMFGGGGFVAVTVDTGGMREIEASLEFGAKIEIDLGVASGGVYIKGGFYFHLQEDAGAQSIYFEGFIEMGGHLSIIGLISVSLVFHLALAYEKDGATKTSRLFGQASLTVEVEILFFSASVEVKVQRQFAGSEADPLFVDFVPTKNVWDEYCEAFA